ncbi:hypothetical protein F2P81_018853 [Scophthalmus maximus]|uniref:Thyroid transcription factor 1-associated protein 26 n=1 Tax=Scophthalmus maximus TaxID=52904 RepID=A0A6A4SBR7_SCOMX|nr:hypothetical protein F2P81_018853 [Scophthalmus maximus]
MAPQTDRKMNRTTFKAKDGNWKKTKGNVQEFKKKRKWVPEHKVFEGSVAEGFAFKRKERVRHEYNKLLRKEKRRNPESTPLYKEEYPEHLRHLYLAEAKKLKQEAWTNRVNRSKLRLRGQESREETAEHGGGDDDDDDDDDAAAAQQTEAADPDAEVPGNSNNAALMFSSSLPMSNRMRKKIQKKTSYQKTKEEFENMKEKRKQKKELTSNPIAEDVLLTSCLCSSAGVLEEQAAEGRCHSEVQAKEDGDVSHAVQKDQEGTAESEPPDGVFASEDPRD